MLNALDLFCGCGGLSLGFEKAGFNVLLGIDAWQDAITTFNYNHKNGNFQNENGKILYKTGKITMNNFYNKKNSFGTSSNLSIPLQIEN